ncbi:hypothetical protein ABZ611_31835 [Streptomyces sp. NPDC007861]|uniref:hypothetical protein n=1 Tax=Streptomyces sp. NPDC007861 TaxID=3154893 RepID=UPI0033CE2480
MTKPRFSHAACSHPSTKAGRAGCRKAMRAAALGETAEQKAAAPKPVAKKDPRKAAPVVAVETTESAPAENAEAAPVETPAAEPIEINADTWKDHRDQAASVYINGVAEPFAAQCITGWSIRFLQFTDSEGKRQRIPASTVERVTI